MSTRPYELLARFNGAGEVAGVSVRTITTVNGKDYESDPMPLDGVDDPAFSDFAGMFAASAVTERDSLSLQVAALQAELAESIASKTALESQNAELLAELDALRNPPVQQSVTPYQIRRWMIENGIPLSAVDEFINSIEDNLTRELARVQWEWGSVVYSDNPLLVAFAEQLGMTGEQIDAAFVYAATLN